MVFRNIAVALTGDATSLGRTLRQGAAQVDDFGNRVEATNTKSRASWLKQAAAVGVFLVSLHAVQLGFDATVGAAAAFDTRMRNVNSITHASDGALRALGSTTLALSRELPQSANTLAEGLYDVASSGFQGARGITVLDASARAASAGLTTTANAAQAIAGSLNAYGLSASSARTVSDTLFQTVNLGVLSFGDLTQGIGQVIGTAAAAGVNLDSLGQAVATLTLAGQQPAEAFTALNQLISQIILPGKALAATFTSLGYESGVSALQTRGLQGVMEDLRKTTGGSADATGALFTDIRGLRGALGLMTDQGKLYGRVVRDWDDAHKGAGATARALQEQLKAVSAQWQLFVNRSQAAGIEAGTVLLPAVLDLLNGIQSLGHEAIPALVDGFHAVQPLATAIGQIFGDVARILGVIVLAAAPVAGGLLAIAGPPVLAALTGLADLIELVTGFLADNQEVVVALAAVYAATLLPSMAQLVVLFNRLVLTPIVLGLTGMIGAAGGAAGAVNGLSASLNTLAIAEAAATAGLTVLIALVASAGFQYKTSQREADAYVKGINGSFDALDPKSLDRVNHKLQGTIDQSAKTAKHWGGITGTFKAGWGAITGDSFDVIDRMKGAAAQMDRNARAADNAGTNLQALSYDTGLTTGALAQLATANEIDLGKPYARSAGARQKVLDLTRDLEKQTHLTGKAITDQFGSDTEAAKAFADAQKKAVDGAVAAFQQATDLAGNFQVKTGKGAASAAAQFHDFVASTEADAKEFADNIETATRRGLDPNVISQLLQQGPERAAPVLQQLVGSNSRTMIGMVNEAEEQLQRISQRIAEFARLTFLATSNASDQMTRDLSDAMRIASENLAEGADATGRSIGKHLHIPKDEVERIAEEFGISLQGDLDSQRHTVGVDVKVRNKGYRQLLDALDQPDVGIGVRVNSRNAAGGKLHGPGSGTSDSLLIAASRGEWVVKERASSYYGDNVMAAINSMAIPRTVFAGIPGYATGGPVARPAPTSVVTVRVPMSEVRTHSAPVSVGQVVAHDYDDFVRQLERRRDLASSPGWMGAGR